MPSVEINDNQGFDRALRQFKRACDKAGIPQKVRKQEAYEKPTTAKKRQKAAAIKRRKKNEMKEQEARERERTRY